MDNRKRWLFIGIAMFLLSFLIMDHFHQRYLEAETDKMKEESYYKNKLDTIENNKEEVRQADAHINRVKTQSVNIENEFTTTIERVVKHIQKGQDMTEKERAAYYRDSLQDLVSEDVLRDPQFLNVAVPDEYELFQGTSRNQTMSMLLKDKKKQGLGYTEIYYDSYEKKVTGVQEYVTDVSGVMDNGQ